MTNEELALKVQNGNHSCLTQLYQQNTGMIEKIVRKYAGMEDPEDLRQEAFFGIRQAALLWDPGAGACFIHYATFWIKQALQRYVDDCSGVVRVPSYQRDRIRRYNRIVNEFQVTFGRDPDGCELASALDLTPEQVETVKRDALALQISSTSEPLTDDGDYTLEDTLPAEDDQIGDLVDRIHAEELSRVLWSLVDTLEDKETVVIKGRYQNGLTLKECGEALGCSTANARLIEQSALKKLQRPSIMKQLRAIAPEYAYSKGLQHTGKTFFKRTGLSSQEFLLMKLEEKEGRRWASMSEI